MGRMHQGHVRVNLVITTANSVNYNLTCIALRHNWLGNFSIYHGPIDIGHGKIIIIIERWLFKTIYILLEGQLTPRIMQADWDQND